MFGDQPINYTLVAGGTIPRYVIVQASGVSGVGGLAAVALADTQNLVGVSQNEVNSGEHVTICPLGVTRVTMGGSCAAYQRITANGSGRATAATSGDVFIGYTMEAATTDGDLVMAMVQANLDKVIS